MTVQVIAEIGINHDGKLDKALKLCDAAKEAGADIAKFQTYIPENCIRKGKDYDLLSKLALSLGSFYEVAKHCENIGIEFCSTPDDKDSLNFLVSVCKVKRIKIGSGSLTYLPLIEAAHATKLPVIVSTGMGTISDIQKVVNIWKGTDGKLTLMHCVSLYPCPDELANVRAMETMRRIWHLPVGYSDHTLGSTAICAAVALNASVVEKHFTLDISDPGPDHKMSLSPTQFKEMVKRIRDVELVLGHGEKEPSDEEKVMIPRIRKDSEGFQPGL